MSSASSSSGNVSGNKLSRGQKKRMAMKRKKMGQSQGGQPRNRKNRRNRKRGPRIGKFQGLQDPPIGTGASAPVVIKSRLDGRNARIVRHINLHNNVANESLANFISPTIAYPSIAGYCFPVLSFLYQAGFQKFCDESNTPDVPFLGFTYMVQILETYILNGTPMATQVPMWLAIIGNALRPKNVVFAAGSNNYRWVYTPNPSNYLTAYLLGNGQSNNAPYYCLYNPSDTYDSNGYQNMVAPSTPYTETAGASAWAVLTTFFNPKDFKLWKLVDWHAGGRFNKDVSAFAFPIALLGSGMGSGFWGGTVSLEVPLLHPLLGTVANGETQILRYFKQWRNISGDTSFVSGLLQQTEDHQILKMKKQPVFKPIDFYRFCDLIFTWVGKLFTQAYASTLLNDGEYSLPSNLGMSFQDAVLLLRSYFINHFAASQMMTQTLFPRACAEGLFNDNVFTPLCVGANCYACNDAAALLLPVLLVENIRALSQRSIYASMNPKTGKVNKNDPYLYVPVLGIFNQAPLDGTSYIYAYGPALPDPPGPSYISIFTTSAPMVINVLDGGKTPAGSSFVNLCNQPTIAENCDQWNSVMQVLSTWSMPYASMGESQGINALQVITMTDVISNLGAQIAHNHKHHVETKTMADNKAAIAKNPKIKRITNPYAMNGVLTTTSLNAFNKAAWTQVQNYWIRPNDTWFISEDTSDVSDNKDEYTISSYANEAYAMPALSTGINNSRLISLQTQNLTYANMMIKGALSPNLQIVDELNEYAKQGRGGILSDIIEVVGKILPI